MYKCLYISCIKLSKNLGISRSHLIDLLSTLEKTNLIFSINPYGEAGKSIRKPLKYYFLSSSLNASINFQLGKHDPLNNDYMGILAETYVASTFLRLTSSCLNFLGFYFPHEKGMDDFILKTSYGNIIAVEIGIGKKTKKQVKKTINKYKCDYGVIISPTTPLVEKEDNVIYLPITTFPLN